MIPSASRRVGHAGGCPTVRARIVSPTRVPAVMATPDDHFTPGPDCCVTVSVRGRVSGASGYPTIRGWVVSRAGVRRTAIISTPDDHFAARPHCCVKVSATGRVGGRCPGIIGASVRPIRYCGKRIISTRRCYDLWRLILRSRSPGLQRLFAPFNRSKLQAVFAFLNYRRRVVTLLIFLQGT